MKTLTAAQLTAAGACHGQVVLFRKTVGLSTPVTRALCLQHASVFDWQWAADHLLTDAQHRAYQEDIAPADRAYDEARASADRAYQEAIAPARRAYDEAIASAFADAYSS